MLRGFISQSGILLRSPAELVDFLNLNESQRWYLLLANPYSDCCWKCKIRFVQRIKRKQEFTALIPPLLFHGELSLGPL